ncbi:hypothetical protein ET495_04600 [Xylanimonas allomyrinae]|uniref:DUF4129 domain-containing protein n=1 Tax=Xylanimonas allomyrinae TaxID=2509459 RepID=A0A4P6EQS1_9MICO|nr:hypothetical protein [Xylanimonas allomyrinae]QAY62657.1 hypothetical protein ET495_04600 [Xylanimonas allomyrinae]
MSRSHVVLAVLLTAGAAALAVTGTLDVAHAVVLAAVAFVTSLVSRAVGPRETGWPRPPAEARPGARKDLSELGWAAFTRDGRVTERVLRRVRAIAARRLAAHGVLWDGLLHPDLSGWGHGPHDADDHHARAEALLGRELLADLTTRRSLSPRTLETWFSALDRLVEAPDAPRSHR